MSDSASYASTADTSQCTELSEAIGDLTLSGMRTGAASKGNTASAWLAFLHWALGMTTAVQQIDQDLLTMYKSERISSNPPSGPIANVMAHIVMVGYNRALEVHLKLERQSRLSAWLLGVDDVSDEAWDALNKIALFYGTSIMEVIEDTLVLPMRKSLSDAEVTEALFRNLLKVPLEYQLDFELAMPFDLKHNKKLVDLYAKAAVYTLKTTVALEKRLWHHLCVQEFARLRHLRTARPAKLERVQADTKAKHDIVQAQIWEDLQDLWRSDLYLDTMDRLRSVDTEHRAVERAASLFAWDSTVRQYRVKYRKLSETSLLPWQLLDLLSAAKVPLTEFTSQWLADARSEAARAAFEEDSADDSDESGLLKSVGSTVHSLHELTSTQTASIPQTASVQEPSLGSGLISLLGSANDRTLLLPTGTSLVRTIKSTVGTSTGRQPR